MPWCASESDCRAKACSGCPLCKGHVHNKRCEPWCTQANCRSDACAGCDVCDALGDKVACTSREKNDVAFEECARCVRACLGEVRTLVAYLLLGGSTKMLHHRLIIINPS